MSIAIEQDGELRGKADAAAANDDHVVPTNALVRNRSTDNSTSESGGWDAYDVWRRFIKEARDRRAGITFQQ